MTSSSESEFDLPLSELSSKKSNGAAKPDKAKSSNKSSPMDLEDSDDDFQPKPKGRKQLANGTTGVKRKIVRERDEGSDDEDDFQPKRSKSSNGKSKGKSKSIGIDKNKGKGKKISAVKKEIKVKKEAPNSRAPSKKVMIAPKKLKELDRADRIAHAMQSFLWWDAPEPPEGCQWSTMEHAGVSFTEPYEPHGVKMKYDGKDVDLRPVEEEA
jgi:DNA topoisomerase-1